MLLCFFFIGGTTALADDIASLNQQGVQAYKNNDFSKAVVLFTQLVQESSDNTIFAENLSKASRSLAADYAKKGDLDNAEKTLREASLLLPNRSEITHDLVIILINKTTTCYNNRNYVQGKKSISEVLQLDVDNPIAQRLAGDIAYALHDLNAAGDHWKRALASDPRNGALTKRLKRLQKETGVERSYSKMEAYTFDIRFDYNTVGNGSGDLRSFLMQAYEQVGQLFGLFPEYPVAVILYKEQDFRTVNNVPGFVAGLYDGKIRIPVNFARYPLAMLKDIIFHEYAHVLVHDLAGTGCPIWLNEGIAMRVMNNRVSMDTDALRSALQQGTTLSFSDLNNKNGIWCSSSHFPLAYAQSWIMVEYLFNRWSASQVKRMLRQIKQGNSFSDILRNDMNRTLRQFDEEWKAFAYDRLSIN